MFYEGPPADDMLEDCGNPNLLKTLRVLSVFSWFRRCAWSDSEFGHGTGMLAEKLLRTPVLFISARSFACFVLLVRSFLLFTFVCRLADRMNYRGEYQGVCVVHHSCLCVARH